MAGVLRVLAKALPPSREPPGRAERTQELLGHARRQLALLGREERADAAYALMGAEFSLRPGTEPGRDSYVDRLKAFIQEYAGTNAALEAQPSLIDSSLPAREVLKKIDELVAFARAHPRTVAGAKALYMAGFQLQSNVAILGIEKRGADPTDRFLRVLGIVSELENGDYPACEWTEKAPELVVGFFASQPSYAPERIDAVLAACESFAAKHWKLDDQANPGDYGIGYFVTTKMAELYKIKGDAVGGVERFLLGLEDKAPDRFAVQYLLAMFYVKTMNAAEPAAATALLDKARQLLASIHAGAEGVYKRKALATMASLAFYRREYAPAREAFTRYVREFPGSPYAWVAAIRIGQCDEQMGDWRAALAAYQVIPPAGDAAPVATVLADVFAGRAHEALGEPVTALSRFRRAVARWDPAFGRAYDVSTRQAARPGDRLLPGRDPRFTATLTAIEARVVQLERTTAAAGGVQLEQARWLLTMKRWQDATRTAEEVVAGFPTSPNAPEARYLAHRALLEDALEQADVEKPGADPAAALAILDRLSGEPFDFAVCVATIARAYIASGSGAAPQSERVLVDTVARWRNQPRAERTLSPLEQDVAEIRSLVFRPNGDGIFVGTRWNGFGWPIQPARFVATAPELLVTLADGQVKRLSFFQRFPHLDNELFVDDEQTALLDTLMTRLGGSKTREGQIFFDKGVMEPPSVPVGPSLSVMAFLNRAFRVMPGHWGGWHFATFPTISEIVFIDSGRTRALVRVTVGYAGGDVLLEKQDGVWRATKLTQTWVT
jgi:outer membrane protein assembly factor BamD (BamD/ComL family)